MAKNKKTTEPFEYEYTADYKSDWDLHSNYTKGFDELEAMLIGQVYDSVSNSIKGSKITDSYTATLAIERAARVLGKLPSGATESAGKADQGKAALMDILRQKWLYPNANSQFPLETKFRLWQLYSTVYGYMPMFYDWNVSPQGYIGPDCWLFNPRNLVPQQGRVSIQDMDYVTALTWVGAKAFEEIIENENEDDGWNRDALKELLEKAKNEVTDADEDHDSLIVRNRTNNAVKKGICIATRYEAGPEGKWISFAPDHGYIKVRELDNPHKNGRIPFVIKWSLPLFDSFYGMGDFQRAKPLQYARDGLINFYFKGLKMNIIPPLIANANGIVKHTVDYREGAVMLETIPNSIRQMQTSNAGLSTFQGAQSNLTSSLLALFGTQNATTPAGETNNETQGKTPAAIKMYNEKEETRDGQEREQLEQAIEQLTDGFFSLIVNIGTEDIPIGLFTKDIEEIVDAGLTDVQEIFSNLQPNETYTGGELIIAPERLKGVEYRFNINPGSTAKENKAALLSDMERLVNNLGKFQNMFKDDQRYEFHPEEIAKAFCGLTDIPNSNKFITYNPEAPSPQEERRQQMEQEQQMQMQQAQQQQQMQMEQAQQQADLRENPAPSFTGGQMFSDPTISAAAKHLNSL